MFTKTLAMIVFATAIAVMLLGYRQERLATMHEMTRLHARLNQSRHSMWDMQVRIADRIEPPKLAKAIERAQLHLEPQTPGAATHAPQMTLITDDIRD